MIEQAFFVILIIFAFMTVQTSKLRRGVIYLAVFSASSAFLFLLMGAPDAALAEAIIGSTLSTIIYLATLQKYRVFTMYYSTDEKKGSQDSHISRKNSPIIRLVEGFCYEQELEPQVVYTAEYLEEIKKNPGWDIIIQLNHEKVVIYGAQENYHVMALDEYLKNKEHELAIELVIE